MNEKYPYSNIHIKFSCAPARHGKVKSSQKAATIKKDVLEDKGWSVVQCDKTPLFLTKLYIFFKWDKLNISRVHSSLNFLFSLLEGDIC